MRILHLISHFCFGGAEKVCASLAQKHSEDADVAVLSVMRKVPDGFGRQLLSGLSDAGVMTEMLSPIPPKAGGIVLGGVRLGRFVKRWRPSAVHLHTEIPEATYALMKVFSPPLRRVPVVRTIHSSTLWPGWGRIGRWVERTLKEAYVVPVSKSAHDGFRRWRHRCQIEMPDESMLRVVYNGVEFETGIEREPPTESKVREVRVAFLGRFEVHKGADLLPAIAGGTCLPPGTRGVFRIYGAGSLGSTLRQWAQKGTNGWKVEVETPASRPEAVFMGSDCILMPSRFEGLAMLALESMAAGTLVVASSAPGLTEVFPPDYPWIAPPGDAQGFADVLSVFLASKREERAMWSEKCRAHVAKDFSLSRMAEEYMQVYRSILQRRRRLVAHHPNP